MQICLYGYLLSFYTYQQKVPLGKQLKINNGQCTFIGAMKLKDACALEEKL